ncbi:shikimate kinase [Pyrococcus abyssi]|uniref:Shikimate kinase n=1 Tax=Pyrococcus abyssi (strain GE5 / Orsay) TaxID=272844 RepID=AROK_PYRAB|nr:shikimate kinase [Pyrococcus abyssi]Q9V1H6.1 RecName: Full=Shikimate kinase; Short=SK [Pyrococcus abyssi GE5]CAB49373.1 aroK shikimate kinase [Pyrococcus abyssi GE5]CCE69834.1 TPA: shikimate kinase [Pyrococcus abyssi GE5]
MRGSGRASSAITIVNAFATGKGAAIGIELWTEARVRVTGDGEVRGKIVVKGEEFKDYRLVNSVISVLREVTGEPFGVRFEIHSDIPVGKGLKSSSAAANSLTKALVEALRLNIDDLSIVKLGVEAAKRAGVTITGAFDDACASYFGGLCITDNYEMEILVKREINPETVVLLIPRETVLTESLKGVDFSKISPFIGEALRLAISGEWKKALVINGLLYSTFLGYDLAPMREALKLGAFVGLCGKGPAFFAIADEPEEIIEAWSSFGDVIATSLR